MNMKNRIVVKLNLMSWGRTYPTSTIHPYFICIDCLILNYCVNVILNVFVQVFSSDLVGLRVRLRDYTQKLMHLNPGKFMIQNLYFDIFLY